MGVSWNIFVPWCQEIEALAKLRMFLLCPVDGYPAAGQMRPADLQNENFAQFRGPRALIANVATLTSLEPQL